MKFNEKIRLLRKKKKLSQPELAKLIGVSPRTIFGYEAGTCHPRKRVVYGRLAEALDVQVDYLLTERDDEGFDRQGMKCLDQAKLLSEQMVGMYSSGELSEDGLDGIMKEIQNAYWRAKDVKRRQAP